MNYYPFHLGDYAAHTGHLEPLEDLVYRRLLDLYYLREAPLPADIVATAKLIRARSMAADVESVLQEFFVLTDDGWRHSRCDEEIAKMQDKQSKARASAAASVNARRAKAERPLQQDQTDAERSLDKTSTDVELPTPTPTPTPESIGGSAEAEATPAKTVSLKTLLAEGIDRQKASDWLVLRKAKRLPLTVTAWEDTKAEGRKVNLNPAQTVAYAVASNWAGFKASWYTKDHSGNGGGRSAGGGDDWTKDAR